MQTDTRLRLFSCVALAVIVMATGFGMREFPHDDSGEMIASQFYTLQATAAEYKGWYLDFDNSRRSKIIDGALSSKNLLLTKNLIPGAYWELTKTDRGYLRDVVH